MNRVTLSPDEVQAIYDKLGDIEKLVKNQSPRIDDPILTTEQVMKSLSLSRRTLQKWRDQGIIEFSAINGKFYYRFSAINKMLDNHIQKMED
jgi:hypothetical protein